MKRIAILSCLFFLFLAGNVLAQDTKVKAKDDKTKVKDGAFKEKSKEDKTKIKDEDSKVKIKGPDGMNTDNMNTGNMNAGNMNTGLPYTAGYSSNFGIGNPAHSKMILDMWKDWDDNAFDRHDFWSDTVSLYLPDGTLLKGKSAVSEGGRKYRGGLKSAKSTVDAWVPLRSNDKNEDWVAIWGTETDTWPDGKVETMAIHEVWRINKDGKIDLMRQFTSKIPQ